MQDWRSYEQQIYEKLLLEHADCDIEFDARLPGRMSGIDRQVDVAIRGQVAGVDALGVAECRFRSRKLGVGSVDRFAGFLLDIGAFFGIMFTTKGYSKAALSRAKHAHIRLDLVDYLEIDDYHFSWELCEMCDPGSDRPPPLIDFDPPIAVVKDGIASTVEIGRCSWCAGLSVKCWACGETTPIWEHEYNAPLECRGGCGMKFMVTIEYEDHYPDARVEILGFD